MQGKNLNIQLSMGKGGGAIREHHPNMCKQDCCTISVIMKSLCPSADTLPDPLQYVYVFFFEAKFQGMILPAHLTCLGLPATSCDAQGEVRNLARSKGDSWRLKITNFQMCYSNHFYTIHMNLIYINYETVLSWIINHQHLLTLMHSLYVFTILSQTFKYGTAFRARRSRSRRRSSSRIGWNIMKFMVV